MWTYYNKNISWNNRIFSAHSSTWLTLNATHLYNGIPPWDLATDQQTTVHHWPVALHIPGPFPVPRPGETFGPRYWKNWDSWSCSQYSRTWRTLMREIRCGASSHILVEPYSQHRCCCCSSEASSRQMLLPPFTGATAGQIASPCYQAVLVSGWLKTDKDGKISRVYFTDTVYCMYMPNQKIL